MTPDRSSAELTKHIHLSLAAIEHRHKQAQRIFAPEDARSSGPEERAMTIRDSRPPT